jgi:biotin synthase-like enzyme
MWKAKTKNRFCAMQHRAESNLKIEYLREYEFIFETALAHKSGAQVYCLPKKPEGPKSRETVS